MSDGVRVKRRFTYNRVVLDTSIINCRDAIRISFPMAISIIAYNKILLLLRTDLHLNGKTQENLNVKFGLEVKLRQSHRFSGSKDNQREHISCIGCVDCAFKLYLSSNLIDRKGIDCRFEWREFSIQL